MVKEITEEYKESLIEDVEILEKKRRQGIFIIFAMFILIGSMGVVTMIISGGEAKVPPTIFNEDGKFGIGTLTPSQMLDVRGHSNFSGDIWTQNSTRVNDWLYNQTGASLGNFNYNETTYLLN